jgi:iron complex outermembrane receptor protein
MRADRFHQLRHSTAVFALLAAAPLCATAAMAQDTNPTETVVVTGTNFNPNVAPAKASLDTEEPQTIINRSYIQDSIAGTADYTTILAIAPSMTGLDQNGPGMSDNGVKNTLRGLPDGMYGITYDGIPFGDTNGPSHHSESYFPASTIGSIEVERGPGNAGNLGAATYGGSVNMYSEALLRDSRAMATASYGSWQTTNLGANYQTGDVDVLGTTARGLLNFQDINSKGYLTNNTTVHPNFLVKLQDEFAPGWTLTAFANFNELVQDLNDNAGVTAAQVTTYGKNFALQNTNPNAGTFVGYNYERKQTDMDYLKLQGSLGGFSIDDTGYTYAYTNRTQTSINIEQTLADIAAGKTEGNGTTSSTGTKNTNNIPGYTKLNAYRVWGNILRTSKDFDFGWLTGQLRAGIWWEHAATQRARLDYDLTKCLAVNCNTWHNTDYVSYGDSSLAVAKTPTAQLVTNSIYGSQFTGYAEYIEHSNWDQYQPFFEVDLHPVDGLTITPGFKYINWTRSIDGEPEQKTKPKVNFTGTSTTTRDLPFVMANYKIEPSWSIYAQYAQGIYIPDISTYENATPTAGNYPKAETTTNYQAGTVFYADNFTLDGDFYYIGVNNNYSSATCGSLGLTPAADTCFVNTGTAVYKGVEAEGTYAFNDDVLDGALNGLSVFLNGSLMSAKSAGVWLKNAPNWTMAQGLIYKQGPYKFSFVNKLVGPQYQDNKQTKFYQLHTYDNADVKASYTFGAVEMGVGVYNIFNSRSLAAVTINDATGAPIGGSSVYDTANRGSSLDQYFFQAARNYQFTVTAKF